jgi:pimeloyl-ACP methyl ester carboxylesterase
MSSFVLVPGAWLGGWVWEPVTRGLRARGHEVYAVTLSGLDEPDADTSHIGLETHVEDVLSILRERDLRDAVIVGHGTSGIVAGIVADRALNRVAHTVYIEAFLPRQGKSALHAFDDSLHADELRLIAQNNGRWPAPDATAVGEGQGVSAEQAEWLARRLVDHPGRTLTEPAYLIRPAQTHRVTYVVCTLEHFGDRLSDDVERMRAAPSWTFRRLDTGLWPMVSAPGALVAMLDEISAESGEPSQVAVRPTPVTLPGNG